MPITSCCLLFVPSFSTTFYQHPEIPSLSPSVLSVLQFYTPCGLSHLESYGVLVPLVGILFPSIFRTGAPVSMANFFPTRQRQPKSSAWDFLSFSDKVSLPLFSFSLSSLVQHLSWMLTRAKPKSADSPSHSPGLAGCRVFSKHLINTCKHMHGQTIL